METTEAEEASELEEIAEGNRDTYESVEHVDSRISERTHHNSNNVVPLCL